MEKVQTTTNLKQVGVHRYISDEGQLQTPDRHRPSPDSESWPHLSVSCLSSQNRSAWFSSSAPRSSLNFWISEGGTVAGWRTADYLFSQDATCPDTLRIFASQDYLMNQVTVFHCLFLYTCEKRQSVKSVCIGHYVLPPGCVQDEVREVVGRLIWEDEDGHADTEVVNEKSSEVEISGCGLDQSDTDSSECEDSACVHLQDFPAKDSLTGYVGIDELPRYSGNLCDFNPKCVRCSNCETCISADSH